MRRNTILRNTILATLPLLLIPASGYAASREQQEMQRDIAQLQDQVRALQSGFDMKMAELRTLVEQALDAGNKANTNVSVLSANVAQTLDRELKDSLRPVAGLAAKLDNVNNDVSEVKNSMADLNTQLNRQQQLLNDINNAIKSLQAPPAAPPPSNTNNDASTRPLPPASVMYSEAYSDYSSKPDFAATEFAAFLKAYPDDPNAPDAQFWIGQIHASQQKYDQAVQDFDAVLERYPENKRTPDAYFMKGMALKANGHRDDAATDFRALIKKYPRSDQAGQATEQLRSMGLTAGSSTATTRRKK
jgi:tol-pal system protein YbgF